MNSFFELHFFRNLNETNLMQEQERVKWNSKKNLMFDVGFFKR